MDLPLTVSSRFFFEILYFFVKKTSIKVKIQLFLTETKLVLLFLAVFISKNMVKTNINQQMQKIGLSCRRLP